MTLDHRSLWICIDGVEAVGKTTIARRLATDLGAIIVSEFSDAPFGGALRTAVRTTPHYISQSALGQSLVFIGDFVELIKTKVQPELSRERIVVTDRGYLSKYAYQEVVLERDLTTNDARSLLDGIFRHLPIPDATILLRADPMTLRRRLIERGETCDDDRLGFMERASKAAAARLDRLPSIPAATVDSSRRVEATLEDVEHAINRIVGIK